MKRQQLTAKYYGKCRACAGKIAKGDPIVYDGKDSLGKGMTYHVACAPAEPNNQQPNAQEESPVSVAKQVVVTVSIINEDGSLHHSSDYRCGCDHPDHLSALPCSRRVKARVTHEAISACFGGDVTRIGISDPRQVPAAECGEMSTIKHVFGIDVSANQPPRQKLNPDTPADAAAETLKRVRDLLGGAMDEEAVAAIAQRLIDATIYPLIEDLKAGMVVTKRFEVPALDATIEAQPGEIQHPQYERLARYIAGGMTRVWITGDAGTGKTHAVVQIAKALNLPLYTITPVSDKYELFGYCDANGRYVPTQLYLWAKDENPRAMLLIDEIDACMPGALVAANAALANGHAVFPADGNVEIGREKIVIATANTTGEGATIRYTSRLAQDTALIDRFQAFVHWGIHEPTERAVALMQSPYQTTGKAVDASVRIRKNLEKTGIDLPWGPRRTYALVKAVACGDSIREAALSAGLCRLDEQQRARALEGVQS